MHLNLNPKPKSFQTPLDLLSKSKRTNSALTQLHYNFMWLHTSHRSIYSCSHCIKPSRYKKIWCTQACCVNVLSSLYNLLYSNSRSDGFTPSYTHAVKTPAAPNQGEKKRPQWMHLSVPGACPYLTMMVNILTLLTKGDRRREGGREDRFLRM